MAAVPNIYSKAGDHKLLMGVESVRAPEADSSLNEIGGAGENPPEAAKLLSLSRNSLLFQGRRWIAAIIAVV